MVADLSTAGHAEKVQLIEAGLQRIRALRAARGFPHWVVVDEAHYSLHPDGVSAEAFHPDDKGFCFVTHRPSWLRPAVIESIDVFILARTTRPEELDFLRAHVAPSGVAAAPVLPAREFLLADARRRARDLRGAAAPHAPRPPPAQVRGPPGGPHHRFAFQLPGRAPFAVAATLGEFAGAIGQVDDAVLEHHAAHGDFSRWVLDVFDDRHLGGHLRKIERRWARGEIGDLRDALTQPLGAVVGGPGPPSRAPEGRLHVPARGARPCVIDRVTAARRSRATALTAATGVDAVERDGLRGARLAVRAR